MIVYRDAQFAASFTSLRQRLLSARRCHQHSDLDALRDLLIQAGQLEQAITDAESNTFPQGGLSTRISRELTDCAADAFYSAWSAGSSELPNGPGVQPSLLRLDCALESLTHISSEQLLVKVPEGFAFYALYPEQYALAALAWLRRQPPLDPKETLVIGIRSIGTTLSALIAATLRAAGWNATRTTVRPQGPPFSRTVDPRWSLGLRSELLGRSAFSSALIADEGPGLSGSSMTAVAEALLHAGLPKERLWFFPGHDHGPGSAASASTAGWWTSERVVFTPLEQVRWGRETLTEALAKSSDRANGMSCLTIENFSDGRWRPAVYHDSANWPAICALFEKTKYRCVLRNGDAVLWKFAGLGVWQNSDEDCTTHAWEQLRLRSVTSYAPPPLATTLGFVGLPWVPGQPALPRSFSPMLYNALVQYLAQLPRRTLSKSELEQGFDRLFQMCLQNTTESLGQNWAAHVNRRAAVKSSLLSLSLPCSLDADMAPHHWIRSPSDRYFKVGALSSDSNHTIISQQPLLWDLAGLLLDWGWSKPIASRLIFDLHRQGFAFPVAALGFYQAAYAAFRLGQITLSLGWQAPGSREAIRLQRAEALCRNALERTLREDL